MKILALVGGSVLLSLLAFSVFYLISNVRLQLPPNGETKDDDTDKADS